MAFKDKLNDYLNIINCSSKELSIKSGISESLISRYRSGKRIPRENSIQLKKISTAIEDIIKEKNISKFMEVNIYNELVKVIKEDDPFDYDNFSKKFNTLITTLKVNINDMAKYIVFDASHISRIRYGKTRPSDPVNFCTKVTNYIMVKYNNNENIDKVYCLLNINDESTISDNDLFNLIFNFLTNNNGICNNDNGYISDFLNNLDNFNLNDYIKSIHFDELKIPNIPFYKTKSKNYYGIEEMKNGELDFFKATVLNKNNHDIFMYSNMPMEDMAKDTDFGKKWMFAIALCLKKGLHLNIIHNLDRPFNEMMLGLESWIPIYMTGQISPYYFKDNKNNIYEHLTYVSGVAALDGECIKGFHNDGKYHLTNNSREVAYYQKKADLLLKKANSLMDIYTKDNYNDYNIFLNEDSKILGNRKRYLSSLPLFTMSDNLLIKILKRNNIDNNDIDSIINYKHNEENNINNILNKNTINDYIFVYDNKNIDKINLSLENTFYDKSISYNYDEYLEHLKCTEDFAKNNNNYNIIYQDKNTFNNISITIITNKYVILSKNNNPNIHFVIRHPKLVTAIEEFKPLVVE